MPYTNTININLGSSKAGLTLSATFHDINGNGLSGLTNITQGFVEFTKGNYLWTYNNFPDNFRGCVAFYNAATDEFLAMTSINPEDVETIIEIANKTQIIENKVTNIEAVIDDLTNPPKEITIEVPQISTKCKNVEITTNVANTPSIEIVTGVG